MTGPDPLTVGPKSAWDRSLQIIGTDPAPISMPKKPPDQDRNPAKRIPIPSTKLVTVILPWRLKMDSHKDVTLQLQALDKTPVVVWAVEKGL